MQAKLTLRLDDALIRIAKDHAARSGKSVSQLVAEYFSLLETGTPPQPLPPKTRKLRGALRGADISTGTGRRDHRRHLEEKYR